MFCTKCGVENADTSKFCRKCGAPLRQRISENVAATPVAPAVEIKSEQQAAPPVFTELPQKEPEVASQLSPAGSVTFQLKPNMASAACYLLGWVTGIIFILLTKEHKVIRFHAWQSLITFGILTIPVQLLLWPSLLFKGLHIGLVILYYLIVVLSFVLWIVLMYKAYRGELFKLPFIGNLAQKLA